MPNLWYHQGKHAIENGQWHVLVCHFKIRHLILHTRQALDKWTTKLSIFRPATEQYRNVELCGLVCGFQIPTEMGKGSSLFVFAFLGTI